jgi:penicillin-insensitive murein endopeptidase
MAICAFLALVGCAPAPEADAVPPPLDATASGQEARLLFGAAALPDTAASAVIGAYARGCLAGAQPLPETGPTWAAMRLSRNRNWGHPELIDFVQDFAGQVAEQTPWRGIYVGDLSQPRGGPMLSGHVSH